MSSNDTRKTPLPRALILDTSLGHTWTQWPHVFNNLVRHYKVPHSFVVTLLYLWSTVMGKDCPEGSIGLSQIPVEKRELRKWIEALCCAGIVHRPYGKAGYSDEEGTTYHYEDTDWDKWNRFFSALAKAVALGGLRDEISTEVFGRIVGNATNYVPAPPEKDGLPELELTRIEKQLIAAWEKLGQR